MIDKNVEERNLIFTFYYDVVLEIVALNMTIMSGRTIINPNKSRCNKLYNILIIINIKIVDP